MVMLLTIKQQKTKHHSSSIDCILTGKPHTTRSQTRMTDKRSGEENVDNRHRVQVEDDGNVSIRQSAVEKSGSTRTKKSKKTKSFSIYYIPTSILQHDMKPTTVLTIN